MRLALLLSLGLLGCAHQKPAPLLKQETPKIIQAEATLHEGKVRAWAKKVIEKQNVCFDITVSTRGKKDYALPANWSAAWVDQKSHYYFLSINQRDPASAPKKSPGRLWTNKFRACATRATSIEQVKSLVLTPRDLPYNKENRSLELVWN